MHLCLFLVVTVYNSLPPDDGKLICWLFYPYDASNNPEISEDEAEDRLQEAIQEKFAVFGEVGIYLSFLSIQL